MSSAEAVVKISVIVTAYNRKDYLLNAVKSVADQTLSKDLYEVVVVKNFEDKQIDDYIRRLGFKNVIYDTPRYGEQVAVGIEESSGDVLTFLEDDDEFEREKLGEVYKAFSQYKNVFYFHDTRRFLYYDRFVDANVSDPLIKSIIEFYESIVPPRDVIVNPFDRLSCGFIKSYPGILATVSLMSVRRECIEDKLALLRGVHIAVEDFIPAFAAECGLLYHTGKRLTRYRVHSRNTSIALTHRDQIRLYTYYMREIEDFEQLLPNILPKNCVREVIKLRLLGFKLALYYAPEDVKLFLRYRGDTLETLRDILELCRLERHSPSYCILNLLNALYNGLPVKPLSRQTLKKALRHGA